MDQGKYNEALEKFDLCIDIKTSELGPEHPKLASTYTNMGLASKKAGNYVEATGYLNKALKLRKTHFGEDHVSVATTLENIAMIEME